MLSYRCWLLDAAGKITGVEVVDCDNDAERAALPVLAGRACPGIEAWDHARRAFQQLGKPT